VIQEPQGHPKTNTVVNLQIGLAFFFPQLWQICARNSINPLNTELNTICPLLAVLEAHHILYIRRIRVKPTALLLSAGLTQEGTP
jgi:hypothetical protein